MVILTVANSTGGRKHRRARRPPATRAASPPHGTRGGALVALRGNRTIDEAPAPSKRQASRMSLSSSALDPYVT